MRALSGHALQGRRDRFILCTKAGFTFASVGGIARLVRPFAKKAVSYLRAGRQLVTQARAVAMRANIRSQDFSDLGACAEASLQRLRTDHLECSSCITRRSRSCAIPRR